MSAPARPTLDRMSSIRRESLQVGTADADLQSPHSPTPSTPNLKTPHSRRTSQPATSPIPSRSPAASRPPSRRASSSASVHRQTSSPAPKLMRQSSRSSLGGPSDTLEEPGRRLTPKRSISNLIAGLREAQTTMEAIEEPIPLTAPQIATDHFVRELISHAHQDTEAETVVILHDACYGHRFSRLRATKAALSMIVERPERIHASILGASAAYVRLGGHHSGSEHAPHPDHRPSAQPPFKIRRSTRSMDVMSPSVTNVHGTQWMAELRNLANAAPERLAAGAKELEREVSAGQAEARKFHEGDLYLAPESLQAFQGALGGVADAVDAVFSASENTTRAFVAVRPPGHHCSADYPSGFCWLNNVHVGIEYAVQKHGLTHAAIFDFDLHHGDGSQAITWQRNSKNNVKRVNAKPTTKLQLGPDIGYYSLHDINSYPCEMGDDEKVQAASLCIDNAHGQSIWNVHLQPWKTEKDFWTLYEERYLVLLEKARAFLQHASARIRQENRHTPKAAIFLSAGFDASEWEGAGMQRHKVNVPTEFYARFTRDVVQLAQETGSMCDGRVISVLEGGYSDRALCSGVLSHLSGLCTSPITRQTNGAEAILGLSSQMNGMSLSGLAAAEAKTEFTYNKDWWSLGNLTALENKVNPPPPPQAKKARTGPQPTYATPTESFAYKVIDANKFARSISGTMREAPVPVRAPTPPPPEVDWVVATQELSKLLIPTDRQTKSYTAEELAAPKVKKERESPVEQVTGPRQLRDRRGKAPVSAENAHNDERAVSRSVSRSSRRETIDVLPVSDVPRRQSRRLSAGSALSVSGPDLDLSRAPPVPALPKSAAAMKPPPVPASAGLDVKKVRAPSKPRKSETLPSRPPTAATTSSSASSVTQKTKPTSPSAAPATSNDDLDNLTSGMKKITLKVSSTREEHDRRQKEKLDAERRARALKAAETRRVNAAAKKAAVGEPTATVPRKPSVPIQASRNQPGKLPVSAPINKIAPRTNGADTGSTPAASTMDLSSNVASAPKEEDISFPAFESAFPTAPSTTNEVVSGVSNTDVAISHMHTEGQQNGTHDSPSFEFSPPYGDDESVFAQTQQRTVYHVTPADQEYLLSGPSTTSMRPSGLPVWSSTGPLPFADRTSPTHND